MKKLVVAIYTDYFQPMRYNGGGLEVYIETIKRELERRGHKVFVVTSGPKKLEDYYSNRKDIIVLHGFRVYKLNPYFGLHLDLLDIDKRLIEMKPDVIHIQSVYTMGLLGIKVSKFLNVPVIATNHTFNTSYASIASYVSKNKLVVKSIQSMLINYLRWFYKRTKVVISPSLFIKRELNSYGIHNVSVLYDGVDLSKLKTNKSMAEARRILGISKNDKVILYLSRVSAEKNISLFIRAAKGLEKDGVKSIVAGSGKDLEKYKELSRDLGLKNIKFTGFVDDDKKKLYYKAADVFCFPSEFETQGLVAIEAMAAGTPVVAPKGTAQAEIIKPGINGETFKKGDLADFINKINKVLENRRKYRTKQAVKEFDVRKHVSKLLKIYTS
ncbi:glycosyltransferase [Candidatus Parvarchaeota archaeon]|uniref:Glycosyltransferase n=1 Tax=Candidatus Acidifodinimicrobium mancum TaxID=2898728 RepID=A0A8T3UTS6_9ARCH|nr:glycosyltransferase [Candidatus Acidifodinimicrobium mancum]